MPTPPLPDPIPQLSDPILNINQIDPPHHLTRPTHHDVKVTDPAILLSKQPTEPLPELPKVLVTPIGDGQREVGTVLQLEGEQGGNVIGMKPLQTKHGRSLGGTNRNGTWITQAGCRSFARARPADSSWRHGPLPVF